ncbi:ribose-phosphate pyrophosphokinase [Winogradskyella eckloniae]|uniref:ribose-phosphate diphosphokinase n=1 Tax=Winogradskyella eckloniae TaxID=1089306 RepID=UPI0015670EBE|nr:ribose-phosphate diphosphokinase [Winogradskyella eckloniae]NRD19276.1 ribose-phosphate pyrophosphokinase [Winogradskyella eckloniae]
MILNLDTSFQPLGKDNTIQFNSFTFSGGEPHIKILSDLNEVTEVTVTTRIQSFNDLGLLLIAVDALRRMDVKTMHLFLPYMPAARQDRVMIPGEALSVKVYAEVINSLNFESVSVFDPHSEVTAAVVNNCKVMTNHTFIEQVIRRINSEVLLISPDGGALKKIYKVSEFLGGFPVIECSKKRNVTNGKLEGFKVYEDDLEGKACLIVDDICDGGGTFMGLAEELKKKNAGQLYLAISHGIFSKGVEALNQHFETIFTTDSFKNIDEVGVVQIALNDILR